MKGTHRHKPVNPSSMITTLTEIVNPVLKRPALKNLILNRFRLSSGCVVTRV